jgi:hypothetical protein
MLLDVDWQTVTTTAVQLLDLEDESMVILRNIGNSLPVYRA